MRECMRAMLLSATAICGRNARPLLSRLFLYRRRDAGVCIQLLYKRSLRLPICASPASNDGVLVYWNRTANVAALQRSSSTTSRRLSPLMEDLSVKWHEVDRVSSIEGQVHWSQVTPARAPEGLFPEAPDHEAAVAHERKDESEREWIRRRMLAAGAEAARRALEAEDLQVEREYTEAKAKADRQLQFDDPFFNDPSGFDDDPSPGDDDFGGGGGGFTPPPGVSPPPGFDDPFFNDPTFAFDPGKIESLRACSCCCPIVCPATATHCCCRLHTTGASGCS